MAAIPDPRPPVRTRAGVPPALESAAAVAWRLLVIAAAAVVAGYVLVRLRVAVLPVIGALFLSSVLVLPAQWLRRHGWRPLPSAWVAFVGFLGVLALLGWLVVPPLVDEFRALGPTIEEGVDDIESWLQDEPFELDRAEVERLRTDAADAVRRAARSSAASSALLAVEVVAGLFLTFVLSFFFVKDGEKMQRWALGHVSEERRDLTRRLGARVLSAIRGYLGASAALGVIEATIIGVTLLVVGADLVVPVMVLTFAAAFLPFVGAIIAGVIATLVALVSGGPGAALIVGIVAFLVQQFDNDLLAPVIMGRAVRLHPAVVLVAITAGAAVGGLVGAYLAVPVTAAVVAVTAELRSSPPATTTAPD